MICRQTEPEVEPDGAEAMPGPELSLARQGRKTTVQYEAARYPLAVPRDPVTG